MKLERSIKFGMIFLVRQVREETFVPYLSSVKHVLQLGKVAFFCDLEV